jgi:hypothetical protein
MIPGKFKNSAAAVIPVFVLAGLVFLGLWGCGGGGSTLPDKERVREYAAELYNRSLYVPAVEEYRFYLDHYAQSPEDRANTIYRIADIFFERIGDYENALAQYLKIKILFPESLVLPEVNKKIIACLERLERPADARQALRESADFDPPEPESRPGTVIAEIGGRKITQEDLDFEIGRLPPEVRSQYKEKEKKLEFLRRFIATELMYDSAKRAGLERDRDVIDGVFQAKKNLMVQKLLLDQIRERVNIEDRDVQLYYQAHRERYAEKNQEGEIVRIPELREIEETVARDLFMERQQQALDELTSSLLRAENVSIFDDLVK